MELLHFTAALPWGSGQWISCCMLPHCLGVVGNGSPAACCSTVSGLRAVDLSLLTATLPGVSGQWNSCFTPPHCPGAVGSRTPAAHCLTAWGQWAVELLQVSEVLGWVMHNAVGSNGALLSGRRSASISLGPMLSFVCAHLQYAHFVSCTISCL